MRLAMPCKEQGHVHASGAARGLEHQLPCSFSGPSCARGSPEMWTVGPTGQQAWAGWRDMFEQLLSFWPQEPGRHSGFLAWCTQTGLVGGDDLGFHLPVFGKQRVEGSLGRP